MNRGTVRGVINFILVILYSYIHYRYIGPKIIDITSSQLISLGIWSIIVGVWGKAVGMRLVEAIYMSKDRRYENYFFIVAGFVIIILGVLLLYFEIKKLPAGI